VIGNSNYSGKLSHLKNPTNDARDIKSALSSKGFEVIFTTNADLEEMERKIDKFTHKLKSAKVGFFYFAGHGLEVKKKNYIVPIGANISNEYKVKSRTVSVDEVVERMGDSGVRLSMVVLDACRNDPFHRGGGGLAPKEAHGTLIAYATAPGDVASDGDGDNGLYTKHLLKSLNTPNLKHTEIFRQTRTGVYSESAGKQRPYVSDGTIGVFYFNITDTPTYQKPKPQGNSSFQFSSNKPILYSLTVHTTPSNARVYITNITPKYKDGILLERGKYKLKIKADGYYSKEGSVELKSDLSISVALDKKPVTKAPKPTYSSKDKGSYIRPALVFIQKGSFMMGSENGDSDEKPVHKVNIQKDFYIGKYEVTVGEFRKFIDDTYYKTDADKKGYCWTWNGEWKKITGANWKNPGFSQTEQNPVACVSWNDAKEYTKWLSQKTGDRYRLPSESEWEYVARAGTKSKYSFGDDSRELKKYAWYYSNSGDKTHKVGLLEANPWGVYDMHGNVWEWCEDSYSSYENHSKNETPTISKSNNKKVLRGGSWYNDSGYLRSANRSRSDSDSSNCSYGFRVIREH
jgi:formylglycine-generating enzyme required for sulfatase activity